MKRAARKKKKSLSRPARAPETSLYAPVKAFLEAQNYVVKGEVGRCDVLAVRGDEAPVIVELKTGLTFELLLQGVDRLALSEAVYLAVPAPRGPSVLFDGRLRKLLRRIGLGLLIVHASARVEVMLDPAPYKPRVNRKHAGRLLGEFKRRAGDPNPGGSAHRAKLVTAYRQEALRLASVLSARGPQKVAVLRADAEAPNAGKIALDDYYGWFERVERGVYALTPAGTAALKDFSGRFEPPRCLLPNATAPIAAALTSMG